MFNITCYSGPHLWERGTRFQSADRYIINKLRGQKSRANVRESHRKQSVNGDCIKPHIIKKLWQLLRCYEHSAPSLFVLQQLICATRHCKPSLKFVLLSSTSSLSMVCRPLFIINSFYFATRFSNTFSRMRIIRIWFKLHWNVFPWFHLTISQYWFR